MAKRKNKILVIENDIGIVGEVETPPIENTNTTDTVIIKCVELLIDRRQEGLKAGYYPLGFEPVSNWAKENSTRRGVRIAQFVTVSSEEYNNRKKI